MQLSEKGGEVRRLSVQVLAYTTILVHLLTNTDTLTHTHTRTHKHTHRVNLQSESMRLFTPTISENVSNTRLIVHLHIQEYANAAKSPLSLPGQLLPVINKDFIQEGHGN